jgi:hypothetical protein
VFFVAFLYSLFGFGKKLLVNFVGEIVNFINILQAAFATVDPKA